MAAVPASDIPVNTEKITWTTPTTWKELAPSGIRIGNFSIPGTDGAKAEAAIFSFPGSVGTELDNVNRWRNEVKLPPIGPEGIVSAPVTVDGLPGKLYEIKGAAQSIVVASLERHGDMWFFKVKGDNDVVKEAEPVFRDFLLSIRFAAGTGTAPTASVAETSAENPHGDLSGGAPAEGPKWNIPADWTETQPGPMIFRSFSVAKGGASAMVTVSTFPGTMGGPLANVNRWRGQMTLPPIEQDQLASVTKTFEIAAGNALMVDFTGTDAKTGQPARLLAVMVARGDNMWFFKMLGDSKVVGDEKESFIKFVQTVQVP